MGPKKKIYFRGGLVLVIAMLALLTWRGMGPSEPVYNGRRVSSWMDGHVASSAANPPYGSPGWNEADAALRKIGTNAIPTLLKMISAKDWPKPAITAWDWAVKHHLTTHRYRYAFNQNEEACYAFQVLGTNAGSAVPELARIYERKVTWCSKSCVARALQNIGIAARPALPVLLRDFSSTNKQERFDAVTAVTLIGVGDTNTVLPALMSAAKDLDVDIRWNAIAGLGCFYSRARSAVPLLLDALHDPAKVGIGNTPITEAIETALWRIAPEHAGKPLVIAEDKSLTNGTRMSCSIEFEAQGKRRVVIPTGKPIPAVGDFWNNEPPGTFAVYRRDASKKEGTLLGKFEIQNLPATNENVSLVCVVADGKTVLNARDNIAEKLLEIRKIE